MEILSCAYLFFTGLSVFFVCVTTDNPSPMFDIGFVVGILATICAYIMMLSSSWSDIFDHILLLFQ